MRLTSAIHHGVFGFAGKLFLAACISSAAIADDSSLEAFGKPMEADNLATQRGGADPRVFNTNNLNGTVTDNSATNVLTGNNMITGGSFNGTVGIPIVVQNSGNNVLIQNATIINLQMK